MAFTRRGLQAATIVALTALALPVPQAATARSMSEQPDLIACNASTPVASVSPDQTRAEVNTTVNCAQGVVPIAAVPITQSAEGADCEFPTFDAPIVDPITGEVTISSAFDCAADAQGDAAGGFDAAVQLPAGAPISSASDRNSVSTSAGDRFTATATATVSAQSLTAPAMQTVTAQPRQASDVESETELHVLISPGSVIASGIAVDGHMSSTIR